MTATWPDIVIALILAIGAVKGLRRGFVSELSGAVALFVAAVAAFRYGGGWDAQVAAVTRLGPGSAHVVAMLLFVFVTYAIVLAVALVLSRVARLPLVGAANAVLGAAVGLVKAAVLVWAVLYVALFFPLSRDLRADLQRSSLAMLITSPNRQLDETMRASLPWYVRPFAGGLFARHSL
jgi:uncharacterized membrane protein required for colicin V production